MAKAPDRPIGRKRGRPPAIDNRPDAGEILERVQDPSANLSAIAREIGVSDDCLRAYRDKHTPPAVREALARASRRPRPELQITAMERLDAMIDKVEKILEACDRWLSDPNDPTRYNLDPRVGDVDIVYEETIPGDPPKTKRRTEKLGKLMADLEAGLGITIVKGETKIVDIRRLIVDAAAALHPIVATVGKQRGEIDRDPGVKLAVFLGSPDWARVEEVIENTLRPCPRCLGAMAEAMKGMGGE